MSAPSKFKSKSDNCDEDPPKKRQRTISPPRFAPRSSSSSAKQPNQWITLKTNPGRPSSCPPGSVNINNEYILVNCRHALYVYEITTGLWQHWEEKYNFGYKGLDRDIYEEEPIIYRPESNGLIICNAHHTSHQGNLFAVIKDLNSKDQQLNSWQFIPAASEWCRTSALFVKEYDEIHLFGGIRCTKHRFFCTKDIAQPDLWRTGYVHRDRNIMHHGVVYIPSQHRMLFFGGRRYDSNRQHSTNEAFDTIWEYDFRKPRTFQFEHQWEKYHTVKLPHKMSGFGYILTADERYIVIFGGVILNEDIWGKPRCPLYSDKIFVMDVATMKIVQSQVICPQSGLFRATSVLKGNEKLVRGFIRRHATEYRLLISSDVCSLINRWYYEEEYVHLMVGRLHWKMNIEQIISNIGAD